MFSCFSDWAWVMQVKTKRLHESGFRTKMPNYLCLIMRNDFFQSRKLNTNRINFSHNFSWLCILWAIKSIHLDLKYRKIIRKTTNIQSTFMFVVCLTYNLFCKHIHIHIAKQGIYKWILKGTTRVSLRYCHQYGRWHWSI